MLEKQLALNHYRLFSHKCPKHFIMPENNRAYGEPKLERNRVRDRKAKADLKSQGPIKNREL